MGTNAFYISNRMKGIYVLSNYLWIKSLYLNHAREYENQIKRNNHHPHMYLLGYLNPHNCYA